MKKFICICFIGFVLSACNKKADEPVYTNLPVPLTKAELLMGTWRYTAWTVTPPLMDNGNMVSDVYDYKPACQKDDILIFNGNGNVSFDEGATKCDSTAPQSTQSYWLLKNNDSLLDMGGRIYTISNLSDATLKLTFTDVVGSTTHTHTVTLQH